MRTEQSLWFLAVAAMLTACGDDETAREISFTAVQDDVLTVSCVFSTCHGGASPSAGLSLEAPAYEQIVNVAARDADGETLVVPGDPGASYLYIKLTSDSPAVGDRMPVGSPLDADRTELVRAWIEGGAAND